MKTNFTTINEYIATQPKEVQKNLRAVRATIKAAAPQAKEKISYQMPTFTLNDKNLIHFAAFKHHLGLYPAPSGITKFARDLAKYQKSKGAVQFPLDQPLPLKLITRIVKFRVQESNAQAKAKSKK